MKKVRTTLKIRCSPNENLKIYNWGNIMPDLVLIIIVFVLFILFLVYGMHINMVLLATGILGIYLLVDLRSLENLLQQAVYSTVASYVLTTIPLFILMSQFILQADIVKYLYALVFKLTRGRSGALGVFTMFLGGLLGAVSGSGTAMSAALGQIAVPELVQRGYKKEFAASIAATAGSISLIIPPATGIIIYGSIAQTSISELFIGITIPGIISVVILSITVLIMFKFTRKDISTEVNEINEEITSEETFSIFQYTIAILVSLFIILAIFGGIYLGVFTPTEAGAVGAFVALIAAFVLGKVNVQFWKESINSTLNVTVMVLLVMIGAAVFSKFVTLTRIPNHLIDFLEPIIAYPILIMIILMFIYFILFMFMEGAAVIVMTTPIFLPLAEAAGYSPLEFGILMIIIGTGGMLTPPVGMCVYAVAGVTRYRIEGIFKFAIVFGAIMSVIVIGLLLLFPSLMTWLPSTM